MKGHVVYREAISLGYEKYYEKLGFDFAFAHIRFQAQSSIRKFGVLPESAFRLAAT
jgi:hypothetical protein